MDAALTTTASTAQTATDPVCDTTVAMVDSSLHLDRDGVRNWFCGCGCLRASAADPNACLGRERPTT